MYFRRPNGSYSRVGGASAAPAASAPGTLQHFQQQGMRLNPTDYSNLPAGWKEPLSQFNTAANPRPVQNVPQNTWGQWQGWNKQAQPQAQPVYQQQATAQALRGMR
jgi:hypothetical protein